MVFDLISNAYAHLSIKSTPYLLAVIMCVTREFNSRGLRTEIVGEKAGF